MKIPVTPEFERIRRRYALRFTCEHCVHYEREHHSCSFTFPVQEHCDAAYEPPYEVVVFCKSFELA